MSRWKQACSIILFQHSSRQSSFIPKTATSTKTKSSTQRSFLTRSYSSQIEDKERSSFLDADNKFISSHPHLHAQQTAEQEEPRLASSHLGSNPSTNRFHQPIVYHENYSFTNWPPEHTFPMDKFARLAHALTTTCRTTTPASNLPRPLVRNYTDFYRPLHATQIPHSWFAQPTGPIDPTFLERFLSGSLTKTEARMIGFRDQTNRTELIERTVLEVAGTVLAAQLAFRYGVATNAAGGTHHAHATMGAGYTILNDLAVTANFLMDETLNYGTVRGVRTVLVVDCDVHQGDGTATFDLSSTTNGGGQLITLSLHCGSNYPRYKANSTYDVALPDGMQDDAYLQVLEDSVNRAIEETDPDFVLYDAGVDVYTDDRLGRLHISEDGIRRRDRWIMDRCVGAGIPIVGVIGGGYDKDVDALARRHAIVHEEAAYVWRKYKMWSR